MHREAGIKRPNVHPRLHEARGGECNGGEGGPVGRKGRGGFSNRRNSRHRETVESGQMS